MPFRSESQRRFMWANHPRIAHAWAHGRSSVTGKPDTPDRPGGKGGYRNLPRKSRRSHRSSSRK